MLSNILYIFNILYLFYLNSLIDFGSQNYSMLANNLKGYLLVLFLCLLLSINIARVTYKNDRKFFYLSLIGPLFGGIFPFENNGNLFSNLHEIAAYIAFGSVIFSTYFNIERYKLISYRKAVVLRNIFSFILLITVLLYVNSNGVLGYEETLLLSAVLLVHMYIK